VSQELNISQTAMPLSLHDFVVSVMSGNASVILQTCKIFTYCDS